MTKNYNASDSSTNKNTTSYSSYGSEKSKNVSDRNASDKNASGRTSSGKNGANRNAAGRNVSDRNEMDRNTTGTGMRNTSKSAYNETDNY